MKTDPDETHCKNEGCNLPSWNHWHGDMLCKPHWYDKFNAYYDTEAGRRWCPFCGTEAVTSDAPREMFDEMADDDYPMTCAGDCYIQGVSIPRSKWQILNTAPARVPDISMPY